MEQKLSSRTDFGSNSKMTDFKPQDFLSGNVTATDVEKLKKQELILVAKELDAVLQVEGTSKREVKAILLQALTEKNFLKVTMRAWSLGSDLELQLELKRLELEEAERQRQFESEKEREKREQKKFEREEKEISETKRVS